MGYSPYGMPPPNNSMAIASLVLALAGLGCGITAPIGAVLGHVARRQIRSTGESGDGMALAGIIIGWIITGLMVLWIGLLVVGFATAVGSDPTTP